MEVSMEIEPKESLEEAKTAEPAEDPIEELNAKIEDHFDGEIKKSKEWRKDFLQEWRENVSRRLGTPTDAEDDLLEEEGDQSTYNPDWAFTKTKTANLFSQVPPVRLTSENKQYEMAIPPFAKALNYEVSAKRADLGPPMEEVLNDVTNASGIGAIIIGFAGRFKKKMIPVQASFPNPQPGGPPIPTGQIPDDQLQMIIEGAKAQGVDIPMREVRKATDTRIYSDRLSPANIIIPKGFRGSNFDKADFLGFDGEMTWSEMMAEWPDELKDEDRNDVLGIDDIDQAQGLNMGDHIHDVLDIKKGSFTEIYYWRYKVDPEEPSFCAIWKLVFLHGKKGSRRRVVHHEPWKGQIYDEQTGSYVGSKRFPIRILTITYISDHAIPPSDTRAGYPQVRDLQRSRNHLFLSRKRSIPTVWFNTDRVDDEMRQQLEDGTWMGMIPVQGDGSKFMGQISPPSHPAEDIAFDQATKNDLMETWQIGANQLGLTQPGRRTQAEVRVTAESFATRIGQERAAVTRFFLGCVDVIAGWMVLYSDFPSLTQQEKQVMQQSWNQRQILHDVVYSILPDSSIVQDSGVVLDRLYTFIEKNIKSGFVNPKPTLIKIAELSGIDPSESIIDPQSQKKEPNISYRFSGEDIQNPVVLGMLVDKGEAPSPKGLEIAKHMLVINLKPPVDPQQIAQTPGADQGQAPPAAPEGAHPQWQTADTVIRRREGQ